VNKNRLDTSPLAKRINQPDAPLMAHENNPNEENFNLLKQKVDLLGKKLTTLNDEIEPQNYSSKDIQNLEASFQEVNLNPNSLNENLNLLKNSINQEADKQKLLNIFEDVFKQSEDLEKMYNQAKLTTQSLIQQKEKVAQEVSQLKENNFNKQSVIENLSESLEKSEERFSLISSEMKHKIKTLEAQLEERNEINFTLSNQIKSMAVQLKQRENMIEIEKFNTLKMELVNSHNSEMSKMQEELSKKNSRFESLINQVNELNKVIEEQKARNEEKSKELATLAVSRSKDFTELELKFQAKQVEYEHSQAALEAQLSKAKEEETKYLEQIKVLKNDILKNEETINNLNQNMEQQASHNEEQFKELTSNQSKKLSNLESNFNQKQAEFEKFKASLEAQLSKSNEEKAKKEEEIVQLKNDITKNEETIKDLNLKLEKSYRQNSNNSNLKITVSSLENKIHSLDAENLNLLKEIQELTDELNRKRNLIDDEELENLKEKMINEHRSEMNMVEDKINEKEFYIKSLINKKNELEVLINEKDQLIDEKTRENDNLLKDKSIEIKGLRSELNKKQDEIDKLTVDLAQFKELLSKSEKKIDNLTSVIKQKEQFIEEMSSNLDELNHTDSKKSLQITTYFQKIQDLEKEREDFQKEVKDKDNLNTSLREKLKDLNKFREDNMYLKNQIDELHNQIKLIELSQAEKDEQIDCLIKLNGLKTLGESGDNLDEDLSSLQETLLILGQRLFKRDSNIEDIYSSFHKMFEVMKVKLDSMVEEESKHNELVEKSCNLERELEEAGKAVKSKDILIGTQKMNLEKLKKEMTTKEKQMKQEAQLKEKFVQNERELKQQISRLESKLKENNISFEAQLNQVKRQMSEEKERYEAHHQSLHDFENEKKSKQEENIVKLEEELSMKTNKIKELESINEELEKTVEDQKEKIDLATQGLALFENKTAEIVSLRSECKVKDNLIEKLEEKINYLEAIDIERESMSKDRVDQFNCLEDKLIYQYKKEINLLETELVEKNAALEEVHEYYNQKLKEKDEELKGMCKDANFFTNDHSFQVKAMQKSLLQYQ